MNKNLTVAIVSAYGRGHWLAAELKSLNVDVKLIEITNKLGNWTAEDSEGPFGLFNVNDLSTSQKERLDQEDYSDAVPEGLSIWLKNGPIDTRSSISSYLLDQQGVSREVRTYIENYREESAKVRNERVKKIKKIKFSESWLAHFSHSLAGAVYENSLESLDSGRPLPIFSPLFVRRVSRRGFEKSLTWVRDRGVDVYANATLKDISLVNNQLHKIEIESEWSGVIAADQLVWAISSAETKRLGENFLQQFFPRGELRPEWVWTRFRLDLQNPAAYEFLPTQFVMVGDLALSWTHANLLWLQKTASADRLDCWIRIPEAHRFHKGYLEEQGKEMIRLITARLPNCQAKIVDYPQEHLYDEATLGLACFGLYNKSKLAKLKRSSSPTIHFDGPELWEALDWTGQFDHQAQIFANIKSWKQEIDRKIERMIEKENLKREKELRGGKS